MSQGSFQTDWLKRFSDPYALLGVSVAADDRRVLKRYRNVAKILHPDSDVMAEELTKELASQILARLVNPAYQKLKQEKGRAETVAVLRFQVRRLNREQSMVVDSKLARELMGQPVKDVDVFYEQAIADLAEVQYQPLSNFETITQQLGELNLVYLQLKMGDVFIREKRTGLVSATEAKPVQFTPIVPDAAPPSESYAQRHYRRAQEYMKKGNWSQAVQELRDAIKLEADKSEYHALLGLAYLQQNLPGMATVYCRQALKLNPKEPLALRYAAKVKVEVAAQPETAKTPLDASKTAAKEDKGGGLFGLFRARK